MLEGMAWCGLGLLTACGATPRPSFAAPRANTESAFLESADVGPSQPSPSAVAASVATAVVPTAVPTATLRPTANPTDTPPPTATLEPPTATATIISYDAARLTDLLGESITSYAGSIPSRVTNVRLATRLINGAAVAPGAVFSFDERVGAQTIAAGFDVAWGIISRDGKPVTVPSIAGGICQVATTLFQAVYWAGLPIVERHHHLYWIAHYGQPPFGQVGLDATVDLPPVDFRFRNTTSDWLRIVGSYDSTHVRMRIYGVSPGWKVTSSPTKITNLVKTDRTIIRRDDPTQRAGYELWIEAAEDGFDATVERLVTKGGKTVDRYLFTNHYDPAHNVMLVGTKGATPTATPAATGPTTPSPGPNGTASSTPRPSATTVSPTSTATRTGG